MKALLLILLTACCEEPTLAPDDEPQCVPGAIPAYCDAPFDLGPGWCTTYHAHVNGGDQLVASCNPKCTDDGHCAAGWQAVIVEAVCICGEI